MPYATFRRSVAAFHCRALATLIAAVLAGTAQAQPFSQAGNSPTRYSEGTLQPTGACADLAQLALPDVLALRAREIAATGAVPAHCRVDGTLDPEINFQVNLPLAWNGRFYMTGNGGHAGQQPDDPASATARDQALAAHFAVAATDTGHDASKEPGASFVMSNPQKAIDYAYRAVHLTAVTAKAIIAHYYAEPASRAYWNSCSNGGRQGLVEAQRYPEDFDGVVANAPWVSQTGFTLGALWNQLAVADVGLNAGKLALLASHVMNKCDALDGLQDGLIDDPRRCELDVVQELPRCDVGNDGDDCLTLAQAEALQKVYDGPRDSQGRQLFPGFMPGSEALVNGANGLASPWLGLIVPATPGARPGDFNLADNTVRYLALQPPQPEWDYTTFDFDRDPALLERWSRLVDATDINLRAFRARGGKLLMTYGWADQVLQPLMGVHYYEQAVSANGPNGEEFLRLFMIPGMTHCSGGVGPDQHDPVTAIVEWVELGQAPEQLVARKIVDGETVRSRPLCPYPQVARYSGQGSIDAAENFRCTTP